MHIKRRREWEIPEREATPEHVFLNRRTILKAAGFLGAAALIGCGPKTEENGAAVAQETPPTDDPSAHLYPAKRNAAYALDRDITPIEITSHYNNYYEFGSDKSIYDDAQALRTRPWTVTVDGMVEAPFQLAIDDLIAKFPLEERLYRHRCVEAWAMAVPWTGFALKDFVAACKPLSSATYVRFETFMDAGMAPGQNEFFYPWPYVEGLTMAEATNELAFMVTGIYGKPLLNQFGAPLRLATPWKYGFKSIKAITKIELVAERPSTLWSSVGPGEYGFYSNVNPNHPHPRWPQSSERRIGEFSRRPTLMFNGYAEQVASLYEGMDLDVNY